MKYDTSVIVPVPEKCKLSKSRVGGKLKAIYVQKVLSTEYHPDKKYNTDSQRISIGKLVSLDEEQRLMHPNELYYSYYSINEEEAIRVEEKPVLQFVEPEIDTIQHLGMVVLLRKVAYDLGLTAVIQSNHGECCGFIHSIIYFMITTQQSTMFPYKEFSRSHAVACMLKDDGDISNLYANSIPQSDIESFKYDWNKKFAGSSIMICYDSTNCNTKAQGIVLAELGAAKEDTSVPIVNQGMAVKQDDGTPLFNEIYSGSTVDITQCEIMIDTAEAYGYKDVTFLLDRGYISQDNLAYFDQHGFGFILMLKSNLKKTKEAIDSVRNELILNEDNKYYIPFHGVSGTTVCSKLYEDQPERYLHIYYRLADGNRERTYFGDEIQSLENELQEAILDADIPKRGKPKQFSGRYSVLFNLEFREIETRTTVKGEQIVKKVKKLCGYSRKQDVIAEELKYMGFFTIVTSENMTASDALYTYLTRNCAERVFQDEKSGLGFYSYRVHTQEALYAKTHVVFLSEIVKNEIYQKTRSLYKKNRKFYTIPAIIDQLEKIRAIREKSNVYRMLEPLTAKQKEILAPFGIDEDDFRVVINEMNNTHKDETITKAFLVQES